jgi:hypothetical protein
VSWWDTVGVLNSPSGAGAVVPLTGGRALLTGMSWSRNPKSSDPTRVELYKPSVGFSTVKPAPSPLNFHFAVTLANGRVLAGGGAGGGDFRKDPSLISRRCYIYSPANDTWIEVAPLPHPSFWIYTRPAALLHDGRVIVTGGSTPKEAYSDKQYYIYIASPNVFIFDPSGQTQLPDGTSLPGSWVEGEPMPKTRSFTQGPPYQVSIPSAPVAGIDLGKTVDAGRASHETVVLPNGNVLLIGGREYQPGEFYGVPWIDQYNPGTGKWTRVTELPSIPGDKDPNYGGRGFPAVALMGGWPWWANSGRVLIAGGTRVALVGQTQTVGGVTVTKGPFELKGIQRPRRSALLFNPSTLGFKTLDNLHVPRSLPLATRTRHGFGAAVIGGEPTVEGKPLPHAELFIDLFSILQFHWSLPVEPETDADEGPRMGTALTDEGNFPLDLPRTSILTWSFTWGQGVLRTAKRLHLPSWV